MGGRLVALPGISLLAAVCYAGLVIATSIDSNQVVVERKPSSWNADWAFLAISFILALVFLASRNIYDDEFTNLDYVGRSLQAIVHIANTEDVHPPGMYVLSHLAYLAIPSPRWMTLAPLLVLYAGLSAFVLTVAPLLTTRTSRICFLLLATLHPQLMMWSNSIRWYGW
jgi:hypothetical protein